MQRFRDYGRFLTWASGIGYIALWSVTLWTLDHGAGVFGRSDLCRPDAGKVLFYWICDPASPISILASIVNAALTATVWAPVYIAAAIVLPDALVIAVPIIALHLFGLPAALFIAIRTMLALLAHARSLLHRGAVLVALARDKDSRAASS